MSIDFTGVKAITIPDGSVKKITQKSDGMVLWEKPANTITFYVEVRVRMGSQQIVYTGTAEQGMTWEQLCESDYNNIYATDGTASPVTLLNPVYPSFPPEPDGYVYMTHDSEATHIMHTWDINDYYSVLVQSSDTIVADKTYYAAIGY